jgi:outer membrane protein OmpA-like peptidoglycan-associated protein
VYLGKDYQGSNDIFTANLPENLRPQRNALLKGVVVDKETQKPVAATVSITDLSTKNEIASIQANPGDGFYSIVLTEGVNYDISVSQKGYSFYSTQLNLTKIDRYSEIEKRIELVPLKANAKFSLNNVNFDTNSSVIKETFYPELDRVIKLMKENPSLVVEISAHTDNVGDVNSNLTLSQQRAASVLKYLTSKGLDAKRLVAKGYGMSQPLVPNTSDANRALNRRVEFKVIKQN